MPGRVSPVERRVIVHSAIARLIRSADLGASGEIGIRQHGNQLLAAIAGRQILLANFFAQHFRNQAQHLVADAMAEIVVEGLEVVDVEHQHAERLAPIRGRLCLAQEFIERPPVCQPRQRIGPGALFGLGERVADHVELAGLFRKAGLEPGRPRGGPGQLIHELGDQRLRIDAGPALISDFADRLHLGTIVGHGRRQKLLRRPHEGMQPIGRLGGDGARPGRDIGLEQILVGPGVEGTVVVDQEIDGIAQVVMAACEIVEPDGKIGRRRRNPLLGHAPHRPSGDGRGIVVIEIVEA
ncbi:hypothetical protein ACVWXN_008633 [Bradyrhizobium sp. i1.4.4]